MNKLKSWWFSLPSTIRKPIVLVLGTLIIIASALTGWLPGPGGIPLFLVGIAVLSTEFEWAKQLRIKVMTYVNAFLNWYRQHRLIGTLSLLILAIGFAAISYAAYSRFL